MAEITITGALRELMRRGLEADNAAETLNDGIRRGIAHLQCNRHRLDPPIFATDYHIIAEFNTGERTWEAVVVPTRVAIEPGDYHWTVEHIEKLFPAEPQPEPDEGGRPPKFQTSEVCAYAAAYLMRRRGLPESVDDLHTALEDEYGDKIPKRTLAHEMLSPFLKVLKDLKK